ncbi:MAG: CARDB domain-containing protein [Syntrophales bacterium]
MKMKYFFVYFLMIVSVLPANNLSAQTAPTPLKNVKIQARVIMDDNGIYHYYHAVTNPTENTIGIYQIFINISLPNHGISPESVWAEGYAQPDKFTPMLAQRRGLLFVPVAWKNAAPWKGGVGYEDGRWSLMGDAQVICWWPTYNFATDSQYLLSPGTTSIELESISYGLPGIRKVVFKPDWSELDLPDEYLWGEDNTLEENIAGRRKKESLGCLSTTIGPTAPAAYNPLQFNQMLQDYVAQSVTFGWLKDNALTVQLNNYLAQVNTALNENRLMDAQNIITQFMNAVQNGNFSQRTNEAYALLYFNAKYFYFQITRDLPTTIEISPSKGEHFLNEGHYTQARAMQGYQPAENFPLTARVISGPHAGLVWRGRTDAGGNWSFSYKGEKLGIDIIQFVSELAEIVSSDAILWQASSIQQSPPITVTWKGGPDLMLNTFFPPMIGIPFARPTIPLEESTINVGNSPAPASITRYYITKNQQMSPDDAVIGERQVPALAANEISEYKADIPVPANLEAGLYSIYGCADADKQIIELSEANNCRTLIVQVFAPLEPSGNSPPDCSQAKANPDSLWPPNHKYQIINISGVTDPEGDPVTINVNYIKQDEPINGLGDGDTSPDATLNPLQVRAERSGTGNGRVYHVGFTAQDGKGGKCESLVKICVPHDQGQAKVCIDGGPLYDSTKP